MTIPEKLVYILREDARALKSDRIKVNGYFILVQVLGVLS